MRGHAKGGIWSLAWSVESSVLVSAGADHTVRVWDVLLETSESAAGKAAVEGSAAAVAAAAKADGALSTKGASGAPVTGIKKGVKESGVSADQVSVFQTKESPVYKVVCTRMNLVVAGGVYLPKGMK